MLTLRCTAKLMKRMRAVPAPTPLASSGKLGDWFANLLYGSPQLIICVSEKTLLPLILPAQGAARFAEGLRAQLPEVLRALGVASSAIAQEMSEMNETVIAATNNRQVLGSMNDFAYMLGAHLEADDSLLEASLKLAEAPCSPLGMNSPERATKALFR